MGRNCHDASFIKWGWVVAIKRMVKNNESVTDLDITLIFHDFTWRTVPHIEAL